MSNKRDMKTHKEIITECCVEALEEFAKLEKYVLDKGIYIDMNTNLHIIKIALEESINLINKK